MKKEDKKMEKLCSFYVSDWHLATMILPYISHKIEKNAKIVTVLEKGMEEHIKTLVEKLNLKNKNAILNISWTSINGKKYSDIEKKLENLQTQGENVILINGCQNYMEVQNQNIEKWFKKSNVQSILDAHDKVLNTSGEKEIEEVFEGYHRGEKVETKKVVGAN